MKVIQTCLVFFILYTLLFELLPDGSFQKYMKLMGGLIFLLLFFQSIFGAEKILPSLIKNYYKRTEIEASAWSDTKNILAEYQEQMESQIATYLEESGYEVVSTKVKLQEEEITSIEVKLKHIDSMDEMEVKNKLSEVYSLDVSHINVRS
jgi:hypothetical protein